MKKRLPFLAALVPALLAGGCMGTSNRGVESVHQPVVTRADYLLDLQTGGSGLAAGERQRLAGWLAGLRVGYGDKVALDDPAYHGGSVRSAVAEAAAEHGLLLAEQAPITASPVALGTVRVVVSRMTAGVPGCPDHSRDSSIDYNQNTSSNYGCATNVNLAAMIANPQDLIRGAGSVGNDAAASFKAIDTYRKSPSTGAGGLPGGVTSVSVAGGK